MDTNAYRLMLDDLSRRLPDLERAARPEEVDGVLRQLIEHVDLLSAHLLDAVKRLDETSDPLLWGVTECAAHLSLSTAYVRRLADEGKIPFVRVGSRKMYPVADIRAWVVEKTLPAVSSPRRTSARG